MLYRTPSPQASRQTMRAELDRLYTRRSAVDRLIDALEVYERYERPELVELRKRATSAFEQPELVQIAG
jgi:hypothetical protein